MIFEKFIQSGNSLAQPVEGSGLGLALAKEYVELHGGSIHLSSEVGKGCIFKVTIPFVALDFEDEEGNDARILIADDESSILEAVSFYMEKEGYVALPAKTGTQALELFKREKPSLVVLDVMMPEKNGFEVCKEMRAIDPDVPILFLSAKGDIVDKSVGFSSGADDYITKPFIPDELVMRVNSCLRRRRTEAPLRPATKCAFSAT